MSAPCAGGPTDPGLQAERTALAWRRTGLSLVASALVAVRVLPTLGGTWSLVPACLGLAFSVLVVGAAHRRYHRQRRALTAGTGPVPQVDGLLPALVAVAVLVLTLGALVGTLG